MSLEDFFTKYNPKYVDIINEWKVVKLIGKGACGFVYEVNHLLTYEKFAMKIEPLNVESYNQLLVLESNVLKKLQFSQHIPRLICCGEDHKNDVRYLIMSFHGPSLESIRKKLINYRMSVGTVLRVGIQCLQAIQDMHTQFFIHRDIKPDNFVIGSTKQDQTRVYLIDFGLARSLKDVKGKREIRLPRIEAEIPFRGTSLYASINAHKKRELARVDDLWSLFYFLIELRIGLLPWTGLNDRNKIGLMKETLSDNVLLEGCPRNFANILSCLKQWNYFTNPDYDFIRKQLELSIIQRNIEETDLYDWEI